MPNDTDKPLSEMTHTELVQKDFNPMGWLYLIGGVLVIRYIYLKFIK
jgi:hypothetical protein